MVKAYQKFWWKYPTIHAVIWFVSVILTFVVPGFAIDAAENGVSVLNVVPICVWGYGVISFALIMIAESVKGEG